MNGLTFDDKAYIACVQAQYTEPIVIGKSGRMTNRYDAVSWACWDSVEKALNGECA